MRINIWEREGLWGIEEYWFTLSETKISWNYDLKYGCSTWIDKWINGMEEMQQIDPCIPGNLKFDKGGVPGWPTVVWVFDSWFWLRSWSQGHEIEPHIRLCTPRGVCLRFFLPLPLPSPYPHSYSFSLSNK